MKPQSINSLMKNMRNNKGITIVGSTQKRKLRYMGYFHGYKGYRYCNSTASRLPYTKFDELQAVYEFDMKIKNIFYSQIMFLETAIKNYALEEILKECKSDSFVDIYSVALDDYKAFPVGSREYTDAFKIRMSVRNQVYSTISRDYGRNNIIKHYYDKDTLLPIWAIFELLSLGDFGNFMRSCNSTIRKNTSSSVGIKSSVDADGKLLISIIFTLKDLRNAIAHNNTVFDTRFKTGNVNGRISNYITSETGVKNITFNSITDYVVLISFMCKLLECNKSDIMSFIIQFENAYEQLRKTIPTSIYSKIIYTDTRAKLNAMKKYL